MPCTDLMASRIGDAKCEVGVFIFKLMKMIRITIDVYFTACPIVLFFHEGEVILIVFAECAVTGTVEKQIA